jgi:hypothetical protein
MRCKICNEPLIELKWNEKLGDWEVCSRCLEVINDVWEAPVVETDPDVEVIDEFDENIT